MTVREDLHEVFRLVAARPVSRRLADVVELGVQRRLTADDDDPRRPLELVGLPERVLDLSERDGRRVRLPQERPARTRCTHEIASVVDVDFELWPGELRGVGLGHELAPIRSQESLGRGVIATPHPTTSDT